MLRHDLELAKVEDRIEDAINYAKALEAAGNPSAGQRQAARVRADTELQKRKAAFINKVRARAGMAPEESEEQRPVDLVAALSAPAPKRVDTVLLRGDLFLPLDVEGTVWHIDGDVLKMELAKDGMQGFEWPNLFKTDEFRHKKVKPFEMLGGPP